MTQNGSPPVGNELPDDTEIVLVTYRSRSHIEALFAMWPSSLKVVIVDNSDNTDSIADLVHGRENVRLLDGGGQGYARAANLGAFSSEARILVFINPDSRPTVHDLRALVAGLDHDKGAISHDAVTAHGGAVDVGIGGWEPTFRRVAVFAFGLHKLWPRAGLFATPRLGEPLSVDWTAGVCMAVRAEKFKDLGGFDESYYLYMEDVAFGRSARAAGLTTVLREDVIISHPAGTSGAPLAEMLRLRGASFAHYVLDHNRRLHANSMRAILAAGYAARAVQQRLARHPETASAYLAFVVGLLSRRAAVGGVEVARARYEEMTQQR